MRGLLLKTPQGWWFWSTSDLFDARLVVFAAGVEEPVDETHAIVEIAEDGETVRKWRAVDDS